MAAISSTQPKAPVWVHASAWGAFAAVSLVVLVLYVLYRDTDVWYIWSGRELQLRGAFNELRQASIFRERANTISNLGFFLVGFYVLAYAWWDVTRETTERDPYAVREPVLIALFGVACIVLGFGSGAMHAGMPRGHWLDVFGMLIVIATMVALQWGRWIPAVTVAGRRLPTWPVFGFTAIAACLYIRNNPHPFGGDIRAFVSLIVMMSIGFGIDRIRGKTVQPTHWLVICAVSMAVAYGIWQLDARRIFTPADWWLQGHAIWHILNAVSLGSLAIFYRWETVVSPVEPLPATEAVPATEA